MPSYFFLSYAHGDQVDDDRVGQFFIDLSREIRAFTGDDWDAVVGFHDFGNLRAGQTWPKELIDALRVARTFIAFWSPRYFKSQFCGKEWTVFADRIARYHEQFSERPPSIIPVLWVPVSPPPGIGDLHHRDPLFGEAYQTQGLRELMRLDRWAEYKSFVGALARRIREVAERYPLPGPSQLADYHAVPSAFHPGGTSQPPAGPPVPAKHAPLRRDRPPPRPILALDPTDQPDQQ